MFNSTFWAVTQPLGLNNPIAGFVHNLPSTGLYLTQHFLVYIFCMTIFYIPNPTQYLNLTTTLLTFNKQQIKSFIKEKKHS